MSTPATPSDSHPADDRNLVPADESQGGLTLDEKLHRFWKDNRQLVIGACVVVLVAILAYGGWEMRQGSQERQIEGDYAAANTPEKLRAFAAANSSHTLAGIALLRLADDAYAADKFADAQVNYDQAAAALKTGPLAARAQLGAAMARIGAGKTAEGESALRQISGDTAQLKGVRAEASYHLAKLAADAGRSADVAKLSDQLMQMDPSSPWTQRAFALRAALPPPAAPAPTEPKGTAAPAMPSISLPGAGK
ncbi:MAG TPA: tetratricopeptide repeat protein [Opitutaceae bacterium]|nr:tetratricopeptide repeat protein [Opitutaceae bacterium]